MNPNSINNYKFLLSLISALVISSVIAPSPMTYAHPGNTAADGGHYCWTNCEYWGYEYGIRHFHNDEPSYVTPPQQPSISAQARKNGQNHAEVVNRNYIEQFADAEGNKDGYNDGETGLSINTFQYDDKPTCTEAVKFTGEPSEEYKTEFQKSYTMYCPFVYRDKYVTVYKVSHELGRIEYDRIQKEKSDASNRNILVGGSIIGGSAWVISLLRRK